MLKKQILIIILFLLIGCAAESSALPTSVSTQPPTQTATITPVPYSPTATPTMTPTSTLVATMTPSATSTAIPTFTPEPRPIKRVVVISVDGLRPDALAQSDTPILDSLIAAGAYSDSAQTVVPAATLIGHASMLGGMTPEHHGIYWNVYNPELGKINGPTLFTVAHDAGLKSAMITGKPRLEHIVLPGSVDHYDYAGYLDTITVNHALTVIESNMPDMLFVHLPSVDAEGHKTGWMSAEQLQATSEADALIGELVAALETGGYLPHTLLIITADHGGSGFRHSDKFPEDTTIPWLAVGPGVQPGLMLQSDIMIYDTAATTVYVLGLPIPPTWDGRPITEIFGTPE